MDLNDYHFRYYHLSFTRNAISLNSITVLLGKEVLKNINWIILDGMALGRAAALVMHTISLRLSCFDLDLWRKFGSPPPSTA